MNTLLTAGFTDVFRNLGAALRLFWPIASLMVLSAVFGPLGASGNFKTEPLRSIAILTFGFSFLIYVFLILCQGAVGWHRKLLLNEDPKWVFLLPSRRSLQYALPVAIFVFLMLVGFLLEMLITGRYEFQAVRAAYEELKITENSTVEQLDALRKALIPVTIVNFVGIVVVISALLWLGRSWLLAFPHISVRKSQPVWGKIKGSVIPPSGLVGALLIVYFLPSFLADLYRISMPVSVQLMPAVSISVNVVSLALSMVCFLWGLSILSLAYSLAAADKVTLGGTSDLAQA